MCWCINCVSISRNGAVFGSLSALVNGKIKRVSGIRLLGMSISRFGLCVCNEIKSPCVYPLLLFTSAKCTFFVGCLWLLVWAMPGVCFGCCSHVWAEEVKDPGVSMSLLCCQGKGRCLL